MKEWLTKSELSDLNLPGIPTSVRGVDKWLSKRRVDNDKVRPRRGRGGGYEYHYSVLPKGPRDTYVIRNIQNADAPAIDELFEGAAEIPEPPESESAELRRDAILLILNFWDIYRVRSGKAIETARFEFVTMYSNDAIAGIPDWVRHAMRTRDGKPRGLCVNTLRAWERKRNNGDFNALAGNHGNRKGTGTLDTAEGGKIAAFIVTRIVHQPHLTSDHIRDLVLAEFGDDIKVGDKRRSMPPIRTFQRFISKWKDDHAEALAKMTDPDAFKNKRKFAGTNMNAWVRRPNQLWEIDASPADVLLKSGRYSIYAVVDIYTRRMMVTVSKTAKTDAVLGLVRAAIRAWGVPENIRTDNGSDFISYRFKNALTALGIHQDITAPFSPEQKGTVERHIGTLQRGLMPLLPGFVGHNVADRTKIEARKSFAKRLGESDQNAFCVDLDHTELQAHVDRWLEAKYSHKPHQGLGGKTPFEMAASWSGPIRKIDDERHLDILLAPLAGKDGIRVVTKYGITLDKAKFIHGDLVPGDRVLVRVDPQDMGRIYVYSPDGRKFICVAECPERLGVDPGAAIRAAREIQAERIAEEVDPLNREIRKIKPRDMINAVLDVAERKSASLAAFPKSSETYTSPGLEAAADAVRADEPVEAPGLDAEQQVIADAMFAALNEEEPTNVVPLRAEDQRPQFDNDIDFVKWALTSEHADEEDRAYAAELVEKSPTIRLALDAG